MAVLALEGISFYPSSGVAALHLPPEISLHWCINVDQIFRIRDANISSLGPETGHLFYDLS
jgi:hypothetical protein